MPDANPVSIRRMARTTKMNRENSVHNFLRRTAVMNIVLFVLSLQEEDEKERLSQVKELQEEDVGDNTEPLDDLILGLSVGEVRASRKMIQPSAVRYHLRPSSS